MVFKTSTETEEKIEVCPVESSAADDSFLWVWGVSLFVVYGGFIGSICILYTATMYPTECPTSFKRIVEA